MEQQFTNNQFIRIVTSLTALCMSTMFIEDILASFHSQIAVMGMILFGILSLGVYGSIILSSACYWIIGLKFKQNVHSGLVVAFFCLVGLVPMIVPTYTEALESPYYITSSIKGGSVLRRLQAAHIVTKHFEYRVQNAITRGRVTTPSEYIEKCGVVYDDGVMPIGRLAQRVKDLYDHL